MPALGDAAPSLSHQPPAGSSRRRFSVSVNVPRGNTKRTLPSPTPLPSHKNTSPVASGSQISNRVAHSPTPLSLNAAPSPSAKSLGKRRAPSMDAQDMVTAPSSNVEHVNREVRGSSKRSPFTVAIPPHSSSKKRKRESSSPGSSYGSPDLSITTSPTSPPPCSSTSDRMRRKSPELLEAGKEMAIEGVVPPVSPRYRLAPPSVANHPLCASPLDLNFTQSSEATSIGFSSLLRNDATHSNGALRDRPPLRPLKLPARALNLHFSAAFSVSTGWVKPLYRNKDLEEVKARMEQYDNHLLRTFEEFEEYVSEPEPDDDEDGFIGSYSACHSEEEDEERPLDHAWQIPSQYLNPAAPSQSVHNPPHGVAPRVRRLAFLQSARAVSATPSYTGSATSTSTSHAAAPRPNRPRPPVSRPWSRPSHDRWAFLDKLPLYHATAENGAPLSFEDLDPDGRMDRPLSRKAFVSAGPHSDRTILPPLPDHAVRDGWWTWEGRFENRCRVLSGFSVKGLKEASGRAGNRGDYSAGKGRRWGVSDWEEDDQLRAEEESDEEDDQSYGETAASRDSSVSTEHSEPVRRSSWGDKGKGRAFDAHEQVPTPAPSDDYEPSRPSHAASRNLVNDPVSPRSSSDSGVAMLPSPSLSDERELLLASDTGSAHSSYHHEERPFLDVDH